MPPRKRARHSRTTTATASPSPSAAADTISPAKSSPPPPQATTTTSSSQDVDSSLWTDAEETALFRALLQQKPTGIHKHARMLSLHAHLLSTHAIHPSSPHTRIPGIWAKLASLYDLAALDAREDARQLEQIPGLEEEGAIVLDGEWSDVENLVEVGEFGLPVSEDEGVRKEVWKRRLRGKDAEESDGEMPELNLRSTPPRVLDLRTGVEPSPAKGNKKRARKRDSGGRRGSLVAHPPSRRSARQAESVADEAEARSVDDKEEGEGREGGEDEEEEVGDSEEEEESRASTPATRSTRSKGGAAAAKGGTKARGRARAKAK